jgi:ATP-dependent metalloprotease
MIFRTLNRRLKLNENSNYILNVCHFLVFGKDKITTGASGDFQTATAIAQQMVRYYGMNETVGIRYLNDESRNGSELSPHTQEVLDQEIKKYLDSSYSRAKHILSTHARELKVIAEALLEKETLDADQIKKLIEH